MVVIREGLNANYIAHRGIVKCYSSLQFIGYLRSNRVSRSSYWVVAEIYLVMYEILFSTVLMISGKFHYNQTEVQPKAGKYN